jgi:transmembrane protein TMEM260 (protein O-mannosyltransferase)
VERPRVVRPDAAAAVFLFVVYCATLARGVTYWDSGEFLAAIHSLGIPHPPGTPLFVLLAHVWSTIASPFLGFTIAVNAFSALCTAMAFGIAANLFWRATDDAVASFAAALTAGLMSTVWLNATEAEVYACALLGAMVIFWCARQYVVTRNDRWILLTLYTCGLAWSLHLTALLAVPAAFYLIASARRRPAARDVMPGLLLVLLGGSVVLFMLVRAQHDPSVNQGNPSTVHALWDVIQRRQYDVAPLWPRNAPLWLQFGNIFEYADWQVALGLGPDPGPTVARTSATVCYALLGIFGTLHHRAINRNSWRAWVVLFVTASVGVVLYLNLHAGASYGAGVLPEGATHEARDRDYFFTLAFVCWGAWAGFGVVQLARSVARNGRATFSRTRDMVSAAVVVAVLPMILNWGPVRSLRRDEQQRDEAASKAMLAALPARAVFLANGDNDTYPLWYLQQVLGMRRDVTVVTLPLLTPRWNRAELLRRHQLLDPAFVWSWYGTAATVANIRDNAGREGRIVVNSPFLPEPGH